MSWITLSELLSRTNIRDVERIPGVMMAAHATIPVPVGPVGMPYRSMFLSGSENDRNATIELVMAAGPMMEQWGVLPDRDITTQYQYESYTDERITRWWSIPAITKAFSDRGITLAYDPTRQKGNFYSTRSWSAQFGVLNVATGQVLHEFTVAEGSLGSALWKGFVLPAASILVGQYASAIGGFIAPTASAGTQAIVGSAAVSGASTALRGGDFEDVIQSAILGAAGGAAKPYIADAIDYVASLAPGQLADVAGAAEIAYQEQVGIDLVEAQAGAIFDFNTAQTAAQSAATLAPPPSPILEVWPVGDFVGPQLPPSPILEVWPGGDFVGPQLPTWADEAAVAAARSAAESAALAQELVDPVAYPLTDSVAPIVPAEVFPLGPPKMLPVTAEDVIQSVGESVTNLETDYDWLFGYTDPMADFATTDNSYLTDPAGDFFELPDLDLTGLDLTGIDAGYVPTAQDVASNVGYVEAGAFQPVANNQAVFDQVIRNVTVAAGTALTLVRAWREIDGPPPNTTAQARVGSNVVRANPDGTITTTNAAGQVIRTLPPTGQPQMTTDGSMIVNNGDGSYTRITSDGRTTVQRYGTTPAASSGIAGISTPLLIGAGALLVFAVAGGRRA